MPGATAGFLSLVGSRKLAVADDPIVEEVRRDLAARSAVGMAKYGVGLDRTDLGMRDWLQHAYEECLDQACYLKRAMSELDAPPTAGSSP